MGGLIRVAVIVILALLLYRFVKRWLQAAEQKKRIDQPAGDKVENMVRCDFCDVHLPQGEAVQHNGKWYCSEQHYLASKKT